MSNIKITQLIKSKKNLIFNKLSKAQSFPTRMHGTQPLFSKMNASLVELTSSRLVSKLINKLGISVSNLEKAHRN